MAEISWIKLKTTMFDDEKIRLIQSLPEADAILVIWIRLLVLAGKTNDDGLIYIQRNMPYTEEMLATLFNKPVSVVRLSLATLKQFQMVDLGEDGLITVSNWEKHQNIEGMERIREQNRLRKAKQREKQKLLNDVTGQSRDSHATDKDKDIDKELDKDILSYSDEQDDNLGHCPTDVAQSIEYRVKSIDNKDKESQKKSKNKNSKHKYGEYNNVLLSDDELTKLKDEFPTDWEDRIERVSEYVATSGKKYKNFLAVIRNWAKKEKATKPQLSGVIDNSEIPNEWRY